MVLFEQIVKQSNKQLRKNQVLTIVANAQRNYKQIIEDIEDEILRLKMEREFIFDKYPINSKDYVNKDLELSLKINDLSIRLEFSRNRFSELFCNENLYNI